MRTRKLEVDRGRPAAGRGRGFRGDAAGPGPRGTHNMMMVGERAVFLFHLPMFDPLDSARTEYATEHRYQVILEVGLEKGGRDVTRLYTDDRRSDPGERMYTVEPEEFVLPEMLAAKVSRTGRPVLPSFTGTAFRGTWSGAEADPGARQRFGERPEGRPPPRSSAARRPARDTLSYVLFGRGASCSWRTPSTGRPTSTRSCR